MDRPLAHRAWTRALAITALLAGLVGPADPPAVARAEAPTDRPASGPAALPTGFAGRALVALSDADMVASAYVDNQLRADPAIRDALSVISLPLSLDRPTIATAPVSNAVNAWPSAFDLSPHNRFLYVVDTRGPAFDGATPLATTRLDLPPGSLVTSVEISDLTRPTIAGTLRVGRNPGSVSVHPAGDVLAVLQDDPGARILLVRVQDGRFGAVQTFNALDADGRDTFATDLEWHPSGRFLSVTYEDRDEVVFFELVRDGDALDLRPWGNPVRVGEYPGIGRFTPDGRFLIVTDVQWQDLTVDPSTGYLTGFHRGALYAVRFDGEGSAVAEARHEVVSRAPVDVSPEAFSISPDGTLIAVANMRESFQPWSHPTLTRTSSLSLVTLDPASGELATVGEYEFEGILPESVAFDAEGDDLAVVIYDYLDPAKRRGGVEFWRVRHGATPTLERTGFSLSLTRGAHGLLLVP